MENVIALESIRDFFSFLPKFNIPGIIEIIILTYVIYRLLLWVSKTRSWALIKGVLVIVFFFILANVFQFTAIVWIIERVAGIAVIALVVIFQNDLRQALEHLGRRNWLSNIIPSFNKYSKSTSDVAISEICKATFAMAKVKTGALIVIEQNDSLEKVEKTGIAIDGKVTSGLLINIFEKNTPLHDGAVLIVGNIIKAATCYLPLSENMEISKSYGTRHRAALGMSEVSDSKIIVVSEETGQVSMVSNGKIEHIEDEKSLKQYLIASIMSDDDENDNKVNIFGKVKGWLRYEKK